MELRYLFCAHRLIMLYICTKFCHSVTKGSRVTDLEFKVNARVVADVDGHMDIQTNGRKTGSLCRAIPEP